jgi:hypothetical protein
VDRDRCPPVRLGVVAGSSSPVLAVVLSMTGRNRDLLFYQEMTALVIDLELLKLKEVDPAIYRYIVESLKKIGLR